MILTYLLIIFNLNDLLFNIKGIEFYYFLEQGLVNYGLEAQIQPIVYYYMLRWS